MVTTEDALRKRTNRRTCRNEVGNDIIDTMMKGKLFWQLVFPAALTSECEVIQWQCGLISWQQLW